MILFNNAKKHLNKQIGKYKILSLIGEGRYGVCYLADYKGENVVIKHMKSPIFKKNKDKNFYEANILHKINHKNIPKLLDIINEKNFYGLVLEKKEGATVEEMLFKQKCRFNKKEIFGIGEQLIEILVYLHSIGIVHKDIRIPNVIIDDGDVSLIDFGLARWADEKNYKRDIDFSYLGDFLLYLYYSSFKKESFINRPWYEELNLNNEEKQFIKKLFKMEGDFESINEIKKDFNAIFKQ